MYFAEHSARHTSVDRSRHGFSLVPIALAMWHMTILLTDKLTYGKQNESTRTIVKGLLVYSNMFNAGLGACYIYL